MTPSERVLEHGRVSVVDVGSGPPLLLIHGLGGTWRNWEANIPGLARHHRVIALDLPGFGGSEPYAGEVSVARYVATLVELLDQLDVLEATIVGNSMGGLLAMETALVRPDRVTATVLVSSGGLPLTSWRHQRVLIPQARLVNRLLRRPVCRWALRRSQLARVLLGGQVFFDARSVPPELLSAALDGLGAHGFAAALDAGSDYDARVRAPGIRKPTLVVWGRQDPLLPVEMGHELHELIRGSHFEVWDRTGHCAMLEHPARFDVRVTSFIEELGSQRPAS
ncbi:alpha/beta fold hydrolase [Nocardioides caeni]|uniref:alpha/beta fold hydrolase n=1 Tax=Nocardioides caeni TaxID=574700 RepID=UPI0013054316|nr:alpha/beta hydrolase [Nocardioides caeni]